MNKIQEKMVELVEELSQLSIDDLLDVRGKWLYVLVDEGISREAYFTCVSIIDYVIEGKRGRHECEN